MKNKGLIIAGAALVAGLAAAAIAMTNRRTIPGNVEAVTGFDAKKYLGKWYEVARFDYMFEKNMKNVTAEYSLNDDGTIKVVNRGFDTLKEKWGIAEGKAKFVMSPEEGMLKVSFFGPFYAGYNVVAIDKDYRYALVIGRNEDYMWLLSREKTMPRKYIDKYLAVAYESGLNIEELVWTEQD